MDTSVDTKSGNRTMAGFDLRPDGRVYVAVDNEPLQTFGNGHAPATSVPAPVWERLEPVENPAVLTRAYGVPPILHVVPGVRGVQSWEADDGLLQVFVSPQTHCEMLHQAQLRRYDAGPLAKVIEHENPDARWW